MTASTYNNLSLTANSTGFQLSGGTISKTLTITDNITLPQVINIPLSEVYYSGTAFTVTMVTASTYYAILPTSSTLQGNNTSFLINKFSSPSTGIIEYLGTTSYFLINILLDLSISNSADDYKIAVYKNGTITTYIFDVDFKTNNKPTTFAFPFVIQLATSDQLSVYMTDTSANNRTASITVLESRHMGSHHHFNFVL